MEKELRIKLSTISDLKGIDNVKRSFSELERESIRAVSAQRNISTATSNTAQSVDNLSERIGFMGHAYVGFQAVMAGSSYMSDLTKDAIRQADTWNLLEGRLKLVTSSTQQLVSVQVDLFDIAQESRTSYESNADLYARIARATQDMNKSQYETLDVTEAISKSFIVSGAASESAKAAVIQLGQGFASGTLRGEELNSVLEQAPRLAEAIADGMGVSVGKLKDMGAEGKLTAEKVYEAIRTQKDAIEKEFDQMPKTVAQSLVLLQNQIGLTIHEFDQMHGVTTGIAEAISGVTVVLSEHSSEIGDYVGYAGTAVTAIVAWKIGTVALGTAQKIHAAYIAASTVATTSYSIATNTATTSVTTLTARQVAANIALSGWNKLVALNPYAIAGAAIVGIGLVLKDQADQLRDSVRRTAVDVENLSAKALQAKITYATMELGKVNDSIKNPSLLKSAFGNERIDLHRKAQLENELKAYGKQLQKLHDDALKPTSKTETPKANIPTDKELKASVKAAEEYAKNYKSLQDAIFDLNASDHQKSIRQIEERAKVWRDQKMPEVEITKYVSDAKAAIERKELSDLGSAMNEALKNKEKEWKESEEKDTQKTLERWSEGNSALVSYYEAIGDKSNAFYITESDKIQKLAEAGILSNDELVKVWDADFKKMGDDTIKLNTVFEDAFKSMEDSMVNMFMTGKFSAEDFFNTVIEGIIRMQIRNSITEPLTQAIGGVNFGSMFSGMFGGSAVSGVGSEFGVIDGVSYGGFSSGGYTGDGGKYEPKGVVHGGEYVIPKWMVQKSPALIGSLESTRKRGYADGGLVGSSVAQTSGGVIVNVTNNSSTPVSAENVNTRFDGGQMVIDIVIDAVTRNKGGMRDVFRSVR